MEGLEGVRGALTFWGSEAYQVVEELLADDLDHLEGLEGSN